MGDSQREQDHREQTGDTVHRGEQIGYQGVIEFDKCQQEEMGEFEHNVCSNCYTYTLTDLMRRIHLE